MLFIFGRLPTNGHPARRNTEKRDGYGQTTNPKKGDHRPGPRVFGLPAIHMTQGPYPHKKRPRGPMSTYEFGELTFPIGKTPSKKGRITAL